MLIRELKDFRDNVAIPRMMQLFENTHIPDGACYIDNLEITYINGRNWGYESLIEASGLSYRDGRVEEYHFSEYDISMKEFLAAHKDCVFLSDGNLVVSDDMEEAELRTHMRSMQVFAKVFPELECHEQMTFESPSIAFEKMRHLLRTQQQKETPEHDKPLLNDAMDKAKERAAEKNQHSAPPSRDHLSRTDR